MSSWNVWKVEDSTDARDLRVDTEDDARNKVKDAADESPDFTQLRGPSNKYARRISGRNN